jgi:hypothetical protein
MYEYRQLSAAATAAAAAADEAELRSLEAATCLGHHLDTLQGVVLACFFVCWTRPLDLLAPRSGHQRAGKHYALQRGQVVVQARRRLQQVVLRVSRRGGIGSSYRVRVRPRSHNGHRDQ